MERIPEEYICPITQVTMVDPVIGSDGNTYDKSAITEWLRSHSTSPMTRQPMNIESLRPNFALRSMIERYNRNIIPVQASCVQPPPPPSFNQENDDHYYAIQVYQGDMKDMIAAHKKPLIPVPPPPPPPMSASAYNARQRRILFLMSLVVLGIVIIIIISRNA